MQQLVVATKPPFGIKAEARRTGIRLQITTKGNGEKLYADLSAAAAESLVADLTIALAARASGAETPE